MKILGWIIAVPVIAFVLFASARFLLCGPDKEVVKVATPMVQGIADYIVKYGVPESLADIEGLPYALEGCSRIDMMWDKNDHKVLLKKEAVLFELMQNCYFYSGHKRYEISNRFTAYSINNSKHGKLSIKSDKTSVGTSFTYHNNKLTHDGIGTGFDNRFGFCRPFKQ